MDLANGEQPVNLGNGVDARGLPIPGWMLDQSSQSSTRRHKPVWYFQLPNRSWQQKTMRRINQLYKMAPELCWEEKWAQIELEYRKVCPEIFANDGHMETRIERLTNPAIFAGCRTEEEKKAALVGHGSLIADLAASRSTKEGNEAKAYCELSGNDEARIWHSLVESCERASTRKTKA